MELPILADRIGVVENDDSEAERVKMKEKLTMKFRETVRNQVTGMECCLTI